MLNELVVEHLGPIEGAEIALERGSSALTGETGAGKTLLVTAVALLLGGRADRSVVREGSEAARIEGRFVLLPEHAAAQLLVRRELVDTADEIEVVISRTVTATGSKARINGRLVSAATLGEIGGLLVEIIGQHEHHELAKPRFQRDLLDRFAGAVDLADRVAESNRILVRAKNRLDELRSGERERARQLDVLRFEVSEIEAAEIRDGEGAELGAEADRLDHAATIAAAVGAAVERLRGDGGAEEEVSQARTELGSAAAHDPAVADLAARVEALQYELTDIASELSRVVPEPDPGRLESVRERLALIAGLRRKYGDTEAEILEYLDKARARAAELERDTNDVTALEAEVTSARDAALTTAADLSKKRKSAAPKLVKEVEQLLAELAMPDATVEVALGSADLYEGGLETVQLLIATGPGETPKPITKIASGGELSRIGLALHLLTSEHVDRSFIFDEVDAGVGGEAARAVGEAIARLARSGPPQVLVVTHLPQVAAFADRQFRVRRVDGARRTVAVEAVEDTERVEELSRMLAGLPESSRAREHAQELLELAGTKAKT